jgi:hypothetical protein
MPSYDLFVGLLLEAAMKLGKALATGYAEDVDDRDDRDEVVVPTEDIGHIGHLGYLGHMEGAGTAAEDHTRQVVEAAAR